MESEGGFLSVIFLIAIPCVLTAHVGVIEPESGRELCEDDARITSVATPKNISLAMDAGDVSHVSICSSVIRLETKTEVSADIVSIDGRGGKLYCINDSLVIIDALNLTVQNLVLTGCSLIFLTKRFTTLAEIHIIDVLVTNSSRTGFSFKNITGLVQVQNCTFINNRQHISVILKNTSGRSLYHISNSSFSKTEEAPDGISEYGGGLDLSVFESSHITVLVASVIFQHNKAKYGAGISLRYSNSFNCTVEIAQSHFYDNCAGIGGGGLYLDNMSPLRVSVKDCLFKGNRAQVGGGVRIMSARAREDSSSIEFINTDWCANTAVYGSALYVIAEPKYSVVGGFLPHLEFINSTFSNNTVGRLPIPDNVDERLYVNGIGSLYCSYFEMHFGSSLSATGNNGTAFHLDSCTMHIRAHSRVQFTDNKGWYGGAVYLFLSQIVTGSEVKVDFIKNVALYSGGGINYYASISSWSKFTNSCFIQKETSESTGIVFTFSDNHRVRNGTLISDSIYALSLEPCMAMFGLNDSVSQRTVFSSVGYFQFEPSNKSHIKTAGRSFNVSISDTNVIPGKEYCVHISSFNDFGELYKGALAIDVDPSSANKSIEIFPHSLVKDSNVTFKGDPGLELKILMSTIYSERLVHFEVNISIMNCPPGFYLDLKKSCSCVSNHIDIIQQCNNRSKIANRSQGMWMNHTINEDNLQGGYCPTGYCSNNVTLIKGHGTQLDEGNIWNVCNEGRRGILCGECTTNYSVLYHSRFYTCSKEPCHLGWLLYIVTDIVPVTIVFVVIAYSDSSLSSGGISGFVFYSQVLQTLRISGEDHFSLKPAIYTGQEFQSLIYGVFNLEFFTHPNLTFCLRQNATSLFIMSMRYLTQVYSLALVFILVIFLKYNHKLFLLAAKFLGTRVFSINRSAVHGLSALMILSYSQNVAVSIALLRPGYIYHDSKVYNTVVHFYGEYVYNSGDHLQYTILASSSLVVFVLIPTFLLLVYPLHYRVLSFLHISESRCIMKVVSPLEKMKPVFDSFQSTYKDEFRFFSGLYFLYRFIINLTFLFNTPDYFYTTVELELVIVLVIHSLCQPFKKQLHNAVNTILIGNLVIINTISMFHLYHKNSSDISDEVVLITSSIQLALIYAPMVIALLVVAKHFASYAARICCRCFWGLRVREAVHGSQLELNFVSEIDRKSFFDSSSSFKRFVE